MNSMDSSSVNIALVEDDQFDAEFFQRVLHSVGFQGEFQRYVSGEEILRSMQLLGDTESPSKGPFPDLIFLDISLPGMNGKQVLGHIKSGSRTRNIPVIMLSGSNSQRDLEESIGYGCNGYLIKSANRKKFTSMCSAVVLAWVKTLSQIFV